MIFLCTTINPIFNQINTKMSFLVTSISQKLSHGAYFWEKQRFWTISLLSMNSSRSVSPFPINKILPVLLSIERPIFNIKRVSSQLTDKFVSIWKQWEVYLGYELVEQHGFVNLDIIWKWIDENLDLMLNKLVMVQVSNQV